MTTISKNHALEIAFASATDIGLVKKQNEDTLHAVPELGLFVLCDGVGGNRGGGAASEIAARVASEFVEERCKAGKPTVAQAESIVREAAMQASRVVFERGQGNAALAGMATTLDLVWILDSHALIAHVGDGRVYLKRGNEFHRLTEDHTFGAIFLKDGTFTPEQYAQSPLSSHLARAIGLAEAVQVDVIKSELMAGDVLMMCSDGLVRGLKDSEVDLAIPPHDKLDPKAVADHLIQQARARGGKDNASAFLISLGAMNGAPEKTQTQTRTQATPSVRIKIDALRASEFFKELSYPNMLSLLELAEFREFKAGTTLVREGDQPHAIWVLLSGHVEIRKAGQAIAMRDPGVTIGEAALIEHEPRSATVVAHDDVRALEFKTERINAYLKRHAENPAAQIYRALCRFEHQRLAYASGKLAEALKQDTRGGS